jgi:hypothetical protein
MPLLKGHFVYVISMCLISKPRRRGGVPNGPVHILRRRVAERPSNRHAMHNRGHVVSSPLQPIYAVAKGRVCDDILHAGALDVPGQLFVLPTQLLRLWLGPQLIQKLLLSFS